MTRAQVINRLRTHLQDTQGDADLAAGDAPDYLWSNAELLGYWNAGWAELCLAQPYRDRASAAALLTVPAGLPGRAALHPAVLWVERVTADGIALPRVEATDLDRCERLWQQQVDTPRGYLLEPGQPLTLRLWPAPSAATALVLEVARGPLAPLTSANESATLSDPVTETQAQAITWWAASLALQRPHPSTVNPDLAKRNLEQFERAVGARPNPAVMAAIQDACGAPARRVRPYAY